MLVGFIGAPCSGKTTTAAKLFAELKDMGLPAEYVAERARHHIAKKKWTIKAHRPGELFSLNDDDQIKIANSQYMDECIMNTPDVIVVTDSCVLNSYLYMTPVMQQDEGMIQFMKKVAQAYDIVYVCGPVSRPKGADPNRVHDEQFSIGIHNQIESKMIPFLEEKEFYWLSGPSHLRLGDAISHVLDKFTKVRGI